MDNPLRICVVAPLPPPYGGISQWTDLINRHSFSLQDVELHVVDTATRWRAIHDLTIWKRVLGGGIQSLRNLILFIYIIIRKRPHVIHLTTSGSLGTFRDLSFMFIAGMFRKPVIYHLHFGRIPQILEGSSRERWLISRTMSKAHTVIAIDSATEKAVLDHLPEVRLLRIPNCVNLEELPRPLAISPLERTVMFLGWVIPTKGISELIEAWQRLGTLGWKLLIAGPCDPTYQKRLCEKYDCHDVEFLGELDHDEAMELMVKTDIFVLPSYTEGFPMVILEAMALGKAIIATAVGAIPEMLNQGCGILIPTKDANALEKKLNHLVSDEELRVEMGERARIKVVAEYSVDEVFKKYLSVWYNAAEIQAQDSKS